MATLYNIRCYYDTGFDANNRPSSAAVLNNATYRDFPSNYMRQNQDLATTRLQSTWDSIKGADYAKIGDIFYIITGIVMLSDNTAEIGLQVDPLASIGGVNGIDDLGGWAERAHVSTADDTLFSNVLEEPWAPSQPLQLDALEDIGQDTTGTRYDIVQSTVKLDEITHTAQEYTATAASGDPYVAINVPNIPQATTRCNFRIYGEWDKSYNYPFSSFYHAQNDDVKAGMQDVRSLGIDTAIITAYQLPTVFAPAISNPESSSVIQTVTNLTSTRTPSNNMLYRYGNYSPKNNKIYALYNTYHVMSSCSGDRAEWRAEDIYSGGDKPTFLEYADCSPAGKPFLQPEYFHGARTKMYQECVKGEEWLRVPLSFALPSGARVEGAGFARAMARTEYDLVETGINTGVNVIGSALSGNLGGALKGAFGGIEEANKMAFNLQEKAAEYQTKQRVVAPEVKFAQDYGAQGYVGNTFFLWRTRLSENDMERADNFLTAYGYAQDKKLVKTDLTNRSKFNYIKARGAVVISDAPLRLRQQLANLLNNGVRLWHQLPNSAALVNNP